MGGIAYLISGLSREVLRTLSQSYCSSSVADLVTTKYLSIVHYGSDNAYECIYVSGTILIIETSLEYEKTTDAMYKCWEVGTRRRWYGRKCQNGKSRKIRKLEKEKKTEKTRNGKSPKNQEMKEEKKEKSERLEKSGKSGKFGKVEKVEKKRKSGKSGKTEE